MREFQWKQHFWLVSVLCKNLKEPSDIDIPEFPDWVIDSEALDDILFEDEMNEEEEQVVTEKKKRAGTMKEKRTETRVEVKRGKRPVGAEEETEEEDLLATNSDSESLSEGEKQENMDVLRELRKESEEEDPTSSNDEGEDFQDENDNINAEADLVVPTVEHVNEPMQENPLVHTVQDEIPSVNTDEVVASTSSTDATTVGKVFSPTRKMRTKTVARKRKMGQIAEDEGLDVEGTTAARSHGLVVKLVSRSRIVS